MSDYLEDGEDELISWAENAEWTQVPNYYEKISYEHLQATPDDWLDTILWIRDIKEIGD